MVFQKKLKKDFLNNHRFLLLHISTATVQNTRMIPSFPAIAMTQVNGIILTALTGLLIQVAKLQNGLCFYIFMKWQAKTLCQHHHIPLQHTHTNLTAMDFPRNAQRNTMAQNISLNSNTSIRLNANIRKSYLNN